MADIEINAPPVLPRCEPSITTNQDKFSPGRWRFQVLIDSRSVRFRQLPDDCCNTAALTRTGMCKSKLDRR
jgi:hypothetical protein